MKQESKLTQKSESVAQERTEQRNALEFANAEELLRHDATGVKPPAIIEQRLRQSLREEPSPSPAPWWKRFFGK
jgi:hypothetical protein